MVMGSEEQNSSSVMKLESLSFLQSYLKTDVAHDSNIILILFKVSLRFWEGFGRTNPADGWLCVL